MTAASSSSGTTRRISMVVDPVAAVRAGSSSFMVGN
jgi:hypothetical protein